MTRERKGLVMTGREKGPRNEGKRGRARNNDSQKGGLFLNFSKNFIKKLDK